jgi:hypothetical protein
VCAAEAGGKAEASFGVGSTMADRRYTPKVKKYAVKPPPLRPSRRAWKPGALLTAVRKEIEALRSEHDADWRRTSITAESLATKLRAKKSMITTALQRLIEEGLIGHKVGPKKWVQRAHDVQVRMANRPKYREDTYASYYTVLEPG